MSWYGLKERNCLANLSLLYKANFDVSLVERLSAYRKIDKNLINLAVECGGEEFVLRLGKDSDFVKQFFHLAIGAIKLCNSIHSNVSNCKKVHSSETLIHLDSEIAKVEEKLQNLGCNYSLATLQEGDFFPCLNTGCKRDHYLHCEPLYDHDAFEDLDFVDIFLPGWKSQLLLDFNAEICKSLQEHRNREQSEVYGFSNSKFIPGFQNATLIDVRTLLCTNPQTQLKLQEFFLDRVANNVHTAMTMYSGISQLTLAQIRDIIYESIFRDDNDDLMQKFHAIMMVPSEDTKKFLKR